MHLHAYPIWAMYLPPGLPLQGGIPWYTMVYHGIPRYTMISEVGGETNREIVSFRVVRARGVVCEVGMHPKRRAPDFPFSLLRREFFPFPLGVPPSPQPPIQL